MRERTTELGRLTGQLLNHAMVIHRSEYVDFAPVELVALARNVLASAVPLSLDRDVSISFDGATRPVFVAGDEVALREALSNVIHNALTHGAKSMLSVQVSASTENAWIEVVDDGPGIPAAEWDRIREPFHRGQTEGTGSGLGLAIVDDVMKVHRGELKFERHSTGRFGVVLLFRCQHNTTSKSTCSNSMNQA